MKKSIYLFITWAWPSEWVHSGQFRAHSPCLRQEIQEIAKRHGVRLCSFASLRGKLHLLIGLPTKLAASRWVLLLKMATSRRLARETLKSFRWPRDYTMQSLAPSQISSFSLRTERMEEERTLSLPLIFHEEGAPDHGFQASTCRSGMEVVNS